MCYTPIRVKDANKIYHTVPCSKCPKCLARRASAWSFRLMQEEKVSQSAYFITLTYDTSYVPLTEKKFMQLRKRDLQLYFKRVRKSHGPGVRLKYYAVGEYGGKFSRPHYHIILYNAKIQCMLTKKDENALRIHGLDGKLELMSKHWIYGHTTFGQVNGASIGYSLKYISKGRTVPKHANDDRLPEFSLISKHLGINYLTKAMVHYYKADITERMYCTAPGGIKISMPRYYKDKIYTSEQRGYIKGHFEQIMDDEGVKLLRDKNYYSISRNYHEAVKAKFRYHNIPQNQNQKL